MDHSHFLAQLAGIPHPGRLTLTTPLPLDRAHIDVQATLIAEYCSLLYSHSCSIVRATYLKFLEGGKTSSDVFENIRDCCYPYIAVNQPKDTTYSPRGIYDLHPFAIRLRDGNYCSTIADPELLQKYLFSQVRRLLDNGYPVEAGLSLVPVPFPYAVDREEIKKERVSLENAKLIQSQFPMPNTADVEDSVVDATYRLRNDSVNVNLEYQLFDSEFWRAYWSYLKPGRSNDHWWKVANSSHYKLHVSFREREDVCKFFVREDIPSRLGQQIADLKSGHAKLSDELQYFGRTSPFPRPLSYFDGLRTDYSLSRLKHYTHTNPMYFREHQLFTNYHRYVIRFVFRAVIEIFKRGAGLLVVPPDREKGSFRDNTIIDLTMIEKKFGRELLEKLAPLATRPAADDEKPDLDRFDQIVRELLGQPSAQMPAYHFVPEGHESLPSGLTSSTERAEWLFDHGMLPPITLVNIGVGPSNARTMTDHMAVLRPRSWMMVGHCGGLRLRQELGHYVLASSYVRRDGVLDQEVPLDAPIVASSTIVDAIMRATRDRFRKEGGRRDESSSPSATLLALRAEHDVSDAGESADLEALIESFERYKEITRTGTVFTTSNRNWETAPTEQYFDLFEKYRAVAVDMESGTIAANAYRYRVPHGSFLCVSDKPLHGVIKMPMFADDFYRSQIDKHFDIALNAIKWLHSDRLSIIELDNTRSLRALDDPPWR
jgi:nucleoside phosphorylase